MGFSVAAGALAALGLAGLGHDLIGSVAFGLAVISIGWVFAAIGAIAAQLTDSGRTDTVIAMVALGCSYLVRFVADGSGQLWLWLTPLGWSHLVEPFGADRWWVVAVAGGAFAILVGAAFRLIARRDLGGGIVPSRLGPANGPGLRSPLALAWQLQRGVLVAWVLGFAVAGTALGGMATSVPDVIRQSGWGQEFLSRYSGSPRASIGDIFLELIIVTLAMTVAFYSVLAMLRLRAEEVAGRAELVLSAAVSRVSWVVSHLALALLGTVAVLAAGGATLGLAHGLGHDNAVLELGRVLLGALLHVPAAWLLASIALLLLGAVPRYAVGIAWAVLLYIQLIGEVLGPVLLGPAYSYQVANGLQPFHWIPKITSGGELILAPLVVLTGVTALLVATGLGAFRRRDVGA